MKEFNCDLHFHSPYAGGVSKNMLMPVLAEQAKLKGLHVIGTSDILHKDWLKHAKENLVESNGVYRHKEFDTAFIMQTEIQCQGRVHHIIFFPSIESVEELKRKFEGKGNMDSFGCGRPVIRMPAEEIAEKVSDVNAIIGPAHAFTPYFSIYAHFNNFEELYKSQAENIKFMELGLSADSYFADLIEENHKYVFLSNSDSHSPWPHRIGREFNRIRMKNPDFNSLKKAIEMKQNHEITANIGLDPREGKYHCTACTECFARYSDEDAERIRWKCRCNGIIKKGVRDRIMELANFKKEIHPEFRPEYLRIIPLAEIIQLAFGIKNVQAKKIQSVWRDFIDQFGSEINVLLDEPIINLSDINNEIAKKVEAFRKGFVLYTPGGGGNYGKPIICNSIEELEKTEIELKNELSCETQIKTQKSLKDF